MDSKIEELWIGGIIKNEEFSEDILVCGVSFKDFRDWVSSSKFEELGYQRNGSEFVKVLDDGRQVIYDENNDILIITPLFEYEID